MSSCIKCLFMKCCSRHSQMCKLLFSALGRSFAMCWQHHWALFMMPFLNHVLCFLVPEGTSMKLQSGYTRNIGTVRVVLDRHFVSWWNFRDGRKQERGTCCRHQQHTGVQNIYGASGNESFILLQQLRGVQCFVKCVLVLFREIVRAF